MQGQQVPAGARPLATENTEYGPAQQFLCKAVTGGRQVPGKVLALPPPDGRTSSPCHLASAGAAWTAAHASTYEVFVPAAGCSVDFRATTTAEPLPAAALAVVTELGGGPVFACRVRVDVPVGSGNGTHIGHVSASTGRLCRVELNNAVLEFSAYDVLVAP